VHEERDEAGDGERPVREDEPEGDQLPLQMDRHEHEAPERGGAEQHQ
jgi:hypothetical protein